MLKLIHEAKVTLKSNCFYILFNEFYNFSKN